LPKFRGFGVTTGADGGATCTVPVIGIDFEMPERLSVTVSVAVRVPSCVGVNVMFSDEQLA
jgi:hypothetical protein